MGVGARCPIYTRPHALPAGDIRLVWRWAIDGDRAHQGSFLRHHYYMAMLVYPSRANVHRYISDAEAEPLNDDKFTYESFNKRSAKGGDGSVVVVS